MGLAAAVPTSLALVGAGWAGLSSEGFWFCRGGGALSLLCCRFAARVLPVLREGHRTHRIN